MLLGIQLHTYEPGESGNHWDKLLEVARACDEGGLDSVWFADHFMWRDEDDPQKEIPNLECFVVLSALAAATPKVRLGALVAGVPYRNPALLAKMCATLDVVSHGRLMVGLGAGWHKLEFEAYGYEFGTTRDRMEKLEDAVQIVRKMLTERPATHEGKHYSIYEALNDPQGVQKPHPPIMIGGNGEKRTLRMVAQYADYCNVFGSPQEVTHRYEILRSHCERVGRPYEEITRSNHRNILIAKDEAELQAKREKYPDFGGVAGTPEQVVEQLKEYVAVGSQYMTFAMPDAGDVEPVRLLCETVVPEMARS